MVGRLLDQAYQPQHIPIGNTQNIKRTGEFAARKDVDAKQYPIRKVDNALLCDGWCITDWGFPNQILECGGERASPIDQDGGDRFRRVRGTLP
jgi:hypothetical protein